MKTKFISKPVEIIAIQYTGENLDELNEFTNDDILNDAGAFKTLVTNNGNERFFPGDWICKQGSDEPFVTYERDMKRKYVKDGGDS